MVEITSGRHIVYVFILLLLSMLVDQLTFLSCGLLWHLDNLILVSNWSVQPTSGASRREEGARNLWFYFLMFNFTVYNKSMHNHSTLQYFNWPVRPTSGASRGKRRWGICASPTRWSTLQLSNAHDCIYSNSDTFVVVITFENCAYRTQSGVRYRAIGLIQCRNNQVEISLTKRWCWPLT
jgi:hypothetical protein